jgi:uncharacterized membrane protein
MTLTQKNRLFIVLTVVTNTVGNLFLALGLAELPGFSIHALLPYFIAFLSNGWIMSGIALMAVWMLSQLSMYTWADLTYVLPVTAGSYILTALLGRFVLHQQISATRWTGIFIICAGVLFVSESPFRMKQDQDTEVAGR